MNNTTVIFQVESDVSLGGGGQDDVIKTLKIDN